MVRKFCELALAAGLGLAAVTNAEYEPPSLAEFEEKISFFETFQGDEIEGWVESINERYNGQEWIHEERNAAFVGDKGLIVGAKHKHYGITKKLDEPLDLGGEEVSLQYEVRFHDGFHCSGAYIKFLAEYPGENLEEASPYVIMFGPDKCGNSGKVHLIFRHQNPVSGEWEEKHMKTQVTASTDSFSHVYTLQLKSSDQSFRILIDREEKARGKLLEDFEPAFIPPKQIDDPEDMKPEDWVDAKKISDPEAVKPDDWDEDAPEEISDPSAEMPEDWDEEDDGVWEAPLMKNPEYKGKWNAPLIDNPNYKGEWKPKLIDNPNYFEQEDPLNHLPKIHAVAIEILANEDGIMFDNFLLTKDFASAKKFAEETTLLKNAAETSKSKEEKREQQKAEREKKLEEGSVMGTLEYYFGEVLDFADSNPVVFFSICALVLIVPLYLVFFRGSGVKAEELEAEAKHKKDDDANKEDDDDEEEEEEQEEEEEEDEENEEGEAKVRRRRTRRAD